MVGGEVLGPNAAAGGNADASQVRTQIPPVEGQHSLPGSRPQQVFNAQRSFTSQSALEPQ
jgi:hypothetical protein